MQENWGALSAGLPEDILKAKWAGDFQGAMALIEARLKDERLPRALTESLKMEKIILEREMIAEVKDRIRRKNERILQAFELKEMQGMDTREVAERMGDTSRNVYYYVSEARRIAREYAAEV